MKKIAIFVFWMIGLSVLFLIYDFIIVVPHITLENVELIEDKTFNERKGSYTCNYDINDSDCKRLLENNHKLKKALITFKYHNQSFLKTIYAVRGQYTTPEKLPPIIVGNKPNMAAIGLGNIYSRTHRRELHSQEFRMTVLIDPMNYSDTEILEMLKAVKVTIVEEIKGKVLATLPLAK